VGDPDVYVGTVGTERLGDRVADLPGERFVAAEVTGGTVGRKVAASGPIEHDTRCERLDGARHDLERTRFVRFVGIDTHHTRAPGFRFPPSHSPRDTVGARLRRDCPYEIAAPDALAHDDRDVAQRIVAPAGGNHRPVRTP